MFVFIINFYNRKATIIHGILADQGDFHPAVHYHYFHNYALSHQSSLCEFEETVSVVNQTRCQDIVRIKQSEKFANIETKSTL